MRNQNLAILGGILTGAAIGYYLNSDHGRKTRKETVKKAVNLGSQLNEQSKKTYDNAKNSIMGIKENVMSYVNHAFERATDEVDQKVSEARKHANNGKVTA